MTIVDRIRAGKVIAYDDQYPMLQRLVHYFGNAPCVEMTNIASYLRREIEDKDSSFSWHFPGAIPPWKQFVLFWSQPEGDVAYYCRHREHGKHPELIEAIPEADSWVQAWVFCHEAHRDADNYPEYAELVTEVVFGLKGTEAIFDVKVPYHKKDDLEGERRKMIRGYAGFSMVQIVAACSFANCHNVVIRKVPVSRQVRRHAERHGEPVHEHHVIEFSQHHPITRKESKQVKENDVVMPLHLCRGHFARYGSSYGTKRLFGKIEGQFWIPQHVRGSLEDGIITKDYKVV